MFSDRQIHDSPQSLNTNSATPLDTTAISSISIHELPPQCAGESIDVNLKPGLTAKLQSIRGSEIMGERYPMVFISPQDLTTVISESHIIKPNVSYDAKVILDTRDVHALNGTVTLDTPIIFLAGPGSDNFYHWMHDCLPRLLLAEKAGVGVPILIPPSSEKNSFIRESLELLGVSEENIIEYSGKTIVAPEVWIVEDLFEHEADAVHHLLLEAVRERLLAAVNPSENREHEERIFLSREGVHSTRTLLNHEEIESLLCNEAGFSKVQMETLSLREQISIMFHAKEVVAPHGAGLFHSLFMKEGKVTELFPLHPDRHHDKEKILVEPCWYRIRASHEEHGRSIEWNQCDCEVLMQSDTDFSQYQLIVDTSVLKSCI